MCGIETINITLKETKYNLLSPYHPNHYPDNLECQWLFTSPGEGFIIFNLYHLRIEKNFDYLQIGLGHNISSASCVFCKLDGYMAPNSATLNNTRGWMTFVTDSSRAFTGFNISVHWSRYYSMYNNSLFSKCVTLANIF